MRTTARGGRRRERIVKIRTHQLSSAFLLALAAAALVAPSAFADPWGHDAQHQIQAGTTAPVGENATGYGNRPSSANGLDTPSIAPSGEHTVAHRPSPKAPAALFGEHGTGQNVRALEAQPDALAVATPADRTLRGFNWGDAAIGAGFSALLSLLSVGAVTALRRRASLTMRFLGSCVAAIAAAAVLAVPSAPANRPAGMTYVDAIGDAGDAPDITRVTIKPERDRFVIEVKLARPTELGPYGWILFGVDTDRNPFTGGGRGDELLLLTNGEATTFARWIGGQFRADFIHHNVEAVLSSTELTFVLSRADVGARSFNFAVASLREDADLAPGYGVAHYPRR
jgi:hypothetical protein